jgi:hypothetical protein
MAESPEIARHRKADAVIPDTMTKSGHAAIAR